MKNSSRTCAVCGATFSSHANGIPYCNKHYQSVRLYGHPDGKPRVSTNIFDVRGAELYITTKNGDIILADADNLELLSKSSWCISKTGYAVANIQKRVTRMHRHILADMLCDSDVVDHKNGNPLDNRKSNLRICSQRENGKNTRLKETNRLGIKGVRLTKSRRYNVRIVVDGKEVHVGNYTTVDAAIEARRQAEREYYGEFAPSLRIKSADRGHDPHRQ